MEFLSGRSTSRIRTSWTLPVVIQTEVGRLPRRSRSVCGCSAPPVALFVGHSQCVPCGMAANAQVILPFGERAKRDLDIPQAFPVGQLREGHDQELVSAGEAAHPMVACVASDASVECETRGVPP